MRAEKMPEALETLREAVKAGEALGDEGYEPFTQSLTHGRLHRGGILDRFDEAEDGDEPRAWRCTRRTTTWPASRRRCRTAR